MFRFFLCFIGILLALPLLVLVALVLRLPVTISGITYIIGAVLMVSGMILAPQISRYYLVIASGFVVIVLVAFARFFIVRTSDGNLQMLALPHLHRTSWINAPIDEQDALLFGETFFHWIGGDSDSEHAGLAPALQTVYSEMRKDGAFPSPIVSTYLNIQGPAQFDAVIIEPETSSQFGVLFLHGYMGNVTAQCWVIAQAVRKLGGVTVCPSTIWTGEWWRPEGQETLETTFRYLRENGIQRIYLGGFSNGGFSIGRLASQFTDQDGLRGLIFIDGFLDGEAVKELGLPVLVIEGTEDTRVPMGIALQFADEVGELATYKTVDSDHFLIIKQPAAVQEILAAWLGSQESTK